VTLFGDRFTPDKVMLYAAAVVALLLLAWWSTLYWRRKIERWAQSEDLRLVSFRSALFFEGPSKFRRGSSQHVFFVRVEDRNGIRRAAWLMYGKYWGFGWNTPLTKVEWIDDA